MSDALSPKQQTELYSDFNNRIKRDLINITLTQGKDNIIEVERDLETWIPFLITDGEYGTFNAITNFWKSGNGGKIGIYSQSGISNRHVYIHYVKK